MWSADDIEARFKSLNLPPDRQWENLKLSNDFLLGKVMQDIDICCEMKRRILPAENSIYLMKRTRAYHLAMGGSLLEKGLSYIELPDAFVIFICTFDPFKLGRHVYTFRKFCCEDKNLALDDGETTMFLNTRGKDKVSNEMKAFLDFVMGRECDDPFIQKLNRRMELAKHNGK
ncbi:MAG: hypothetical protein II877_02060 [Synergistaceae bacterium]|nr:hypothetical protein [Synergistaceae bacterium]